MSAEIRTTISAGVVNGAFRDSFAPGPITYDQAAVGGGNPGEVDIGTSEEDISFGDVVPGLVCIQNLDAANYVQIGPKASGAMVPMIKLAAGTATMFYLDGSVTLRAKANTTTVKCMIKGYNV